MNEEKGDRLIGVQEAAALLGVKPATVYSWASQGLLPVIRVGRLLKFDGEQVLNWFKDGKYQKMREAQLQERIHE